MYNQRRRRLILSLVASDALDRGVHALWRRRLVPAMHTMNNNLSIGIEATIGIHFPLTDLLIEELIEIETLHLSLLADTQVHVRDVLEHKQQDEAHDKRVGGYRGDFGKLLADLDAVAVDAAWVQRGTIEGRDGLVGEDAGQEGAHHAADAVQLEDVEALVHADPFVDVLAEGADDGGEEADDGCEPDTARTGMLAK